MNYSIETDGTIVLKKTTKEAELLYKAVQSKHLLLRQEPSSKETCKRLLEMQLQLNDAIVESNKAKIQLTKDNLKKSFELSQNGVSSVKKAGWLHRLINFFDNPFCTHDYEYAHTRSYSEFRIDGMVFEKELYPTEVYGTVTTPEGEVQVTWNDRGRCYSKTIKDVHCYDLIRQDQKERDSNLIVGIAFIMLLFSLVIFSLYL